jgi:chemotaxis protein methyltransferase CheR
MSAKRLETLQPRLWILNHLQLRHIQRLIEHRTGINYGSEKDELLRRRFVLHIDRTETQSFDEYVQHLNQDQDLMSKLINDVTINETFLFRDSHQMSTWLERLVKPRADAGMPIRIWSAACSTGEEPVTISLMLNQLQVERRFEFEIWASDVNTAVLEKAKKGIFPARSLKDVPAPMVQQKFISKPDGYQVADDILQPIQFFKHNLFEPLEKTAGGFDFVFLRNVMIYFSDESRKKVFAHITQAMSENSYLLMGHCESPLGFSQSFTFYDEPGTLIFRKV